MYIFKTEKQSIRCARQKSEFFIVLIADLSTASSCEIHCSSSENSRTLVISARDRARRLIIVLVNAILSFFDASENGQEMSVVCGSHPTSLPFRPRPRSRTRGGSGGGGGGALPIVRDNYRINKFTSWRNAYNISTSAKWYRDTVVYHRWSYSPRPVTHCRAYVVSCYPFGSYPPRCFYGANRASREIDAIEKSCVFICGKLLEVCGKSGRRGRYPERSASVQCAIRIAKREILVVCGAS